MRPRRALALVVCVLATGCVGTNPLANEFLDATNRFVGRGDARFEDEARNEVVKVPSGANHFRAYVSLVSDAQVRMFLIDPEGNQEADLVVDNETRRHGELWLERARPAPGEWNLLVRMSGGQAYYAVGFYWNLTRPA